MGGVGVREGDSDSYSLEVGQHPRGEIGCGVGRAEREGREIGVDLPRYCKPAICGYVRVLENNIGRVVRCYLDEGEIALRHERLLNSSMANAMEGE